jgi:hypothetical protein
VGILVKRKMNDLEKVLERMKIEQRNKAEQKLIRNRIEAYGQEFMGKFHATGIMDDEKFIDKLKYFAREIYLSLGTNLFHYYRDNKNNDYSPTTLVAKEKYEPLITYMDDNPELFFEMYFNFAREKYGQLRALDCRDENKSFDLSIKGIAKFVDQSEQFYTNEGLDYELIYEIETIFDLRKIGVNIAQWSRFAKNYIEIDNESKDLFHNPYFMTDWGLKG